MELDPLATAIREISQTRRIIESLIVSSESFDYPKAKEALRDLEKKYRELCRVQARLEAKGNPTRIKVVDFRKAGSPPARL